MSGLQNLQGQTFGRLFVMARYGSKNNRPLWLCNCSCGKQVFITSNNLKMGKSKSCGCLRRDTSKQTIKKLIKIKTLTKEEVIFNTIFSNYKSDAKRRNLQFSLSREEFKNITKQNCFYSQCEPKDLDKGNGIDRLDSTKGYIKGNVVSCCTKCNIMKNTLIPKEFVAQIEKIYNNMSNIKEKLCL